MEWEVARRADVIRKYYWGESFLSKNRKKNWGHV